MDLLVASGLVLPSNVEFMKYLLGKTPDLFYKVKGRDWTGVNITDIFLVAAKVGHQECLYHLMTLLSTAKDLVKKTQEFVKCAVLLCRFNQGHFIEKLLSTDSLLSSNFIKENNKMYEPLLESALNTNHYLLAKRLINANVHRSPTQPPVLECTYVIRGVPTQDMWEYACKTLQCDLVVELVELYNAYPSDTIPIKLGAFLHGIVFVVRHKNTQKTLYIVNYVLRNSQLLGRPFILRHLQEYSVLLCAASKNDHPILAEFLRDTGVPSVNVSNYSYGYTFWKIVTETECRQNRCIVKAFRKAFSRKFNPTCLSLIDLEMYKLIE